MIYDPNWWVVLILAVPFFFISNVIHEGAHGLMAKYFGWGILGFYPYPKKHNGQTYFALILFDVKKQLEPKQESLIWIAPRIANLLFVAIAMIVFYVSGNQIVQTIFAMLAVSMWVDALTGTWSIYWKDRPHTDIWKFQKVSGWTLLQTRVFSGVLFFILTALTFYPFHWFAG